MDYTDTTPVDSGQFDRNYTLSYRANGPGQTLQVTWTMVAGSGNVTLNGAALNVSAPPGTLQFSAATFSVTEAGPTAAITVTRTGGSAGAVTVTFNTTTGGTATAGSDYTAVTNQTVSFADGDTATKTVNITILEDILVEGSETVNLALTVPTGGATLGTQNTAVLTITDNDVAPGTLQFSAATFSVTEAGPTAAITVTRTGGSAGAVTVTFNTTTGGTATAGSDYTAVTNQTVSFADGDTATKTVNITILEDILVEGSETVNLALTVPTGGATLGTQNTAVLTITDNDVAPGTLQFSAATFSVTEAGPTAAITVTRTGGSAGAVTVTFNTTTGGTATAGSDYTAVTNQTVSFADGDTATKTVNITILEDILVEGSETVNLALTVPTGGATLGTQNTAVLTITDNDVAPGTLQFSAATFSVTEAGPTAAITVTRTGGSAGAVTVTFNTTTGGTATAGSDYTAVTNQTVSFADGDTATKTVNITILEDILVEGSETVNLALTVPTGGATLGTQNTAVLTITDNDVAPGTLQFSAATFSVTEAGPTAAITVTRTGGSAGAVTVTFNTTTGGTATAGSDYTAVTNQTVSFADGDTATKTVNITILEDILVEGSETVNLALTVPTGGATLGTQNTAVLTITDNDVAPGTLQFSAATFSVTEAGPTAAITVTRTGGSAGAVTVTFNTTTGGTATAGSDYTAVTNQTVSFADGDTATKTVNITILEDILVEGSETVNLALTVPTGGATLGTQNTAVLTITDNDVAPGTLQFSAATFSVTEAGPTAAITVTRTGGSAGAVTVTFNTTTGGTATAGSDYTAVTNQTVSFADGDTATKTVNITILEDILVEGSETVNLALTVPTGGATLGTQNTAVLTITDN